MRISDWSSDVCSSDLTTTLATALAAGRTAKHLHFVGDDVGAVALYPVLAGVLVGAQAAFDINLTPLLEVLTRNLGKAAEELHPMPFGAFLLLPLLVGPCLGGRHADGGDRRSSLAVLHIRKIGRAHV